MSHAAAEAVRRTHTERIATANGVKVGQCPVGLMVATMRSAILVWIGGTLLIPSSSTTSLISPSVAS
jgi:hypothetical protein